MAALARLKEPLTESVFIELAAGTYGETITKSPDYSATNERPEADVALRVSFYFTRGS